MIVDRKWNLVLEAGEDTQEEIDLWVRIMLSSYRGKDQQEKQCVL
jgi:hypothetical protein